jgi:hypothetical protein
MTARRGPRLELRDTSLQAYLSRSDSAVDRSVRWFAGWALVDSKPNEVVTAKLMITRAFEHWPFTRSRP